ncbi:hypothetical protein TRFO_05456 [Tritrichomonas foetus]|uniref:Uncharacterized protein n=1 Tax=Tritrichomonas foetus TaxID=1144522 RepID=A0A1J4K710_9EUKA|nr:hypothetical protein TRFO_05456 [Tritrichomonas foetus]|eukprot:OHT06770.1 hypothetical protein TRFO_05456 [Tritrichomonas foetus]
MSKPNTSSLLHQYCYELEKTCFSYYDLIDKLRQEIAAANKTRPYQNELNNKDEQIQFLVNENNNLRRSIESNGGTAAPANDDQYNELATKYNELADAYEELEREKEATERRYIAYANKVYSKKK